MPLKKGYSRSSVSHNIEEMVAAGHPQRQAVAAALTTADKAKQKVAGRGFKTGGTIPKTRW